MYMQVFVYIYILCICKYLYIYIYYILYNIYVHILHILYMLYIFVVKKTENVLSRWLPIRQWSHSNCTSCAQVHELPFGHWWIGNNQEGTLFVFLTTYIHIYI